MAIAGAGGLAKILDPTEVFAQARNFSPPPPLVSPIAGLMDTHIHSAPDVFGRSLDDDQVAGLARERGMEAIVLKNHVVTTADRAWFARKHAQAHFQDLGTRIAGFLDGVAAAADRGHKDLDRLTLAREILGVQLKGRRSTSRLPALVDLLLSKPLVSVPLAAKELKASPQAVEGMIGKLGAAARELTGRGRYRAWGII